MTEKPSRKGAVSFILAAAVAARGASGGGAIPDAESATHGYEAASYVVGNTYQFSGGKILQIELGVLSHYSYLVVSGAEALVIDPGRDARAYFEFAAKEGAKIGGVFLTHLHADFVAGHREVERRAGCPIYQSASSGAAYPIQGLKEGSAIRVGSATIKAIETPGHTPDGVCGALYEKEGQPEPFALFTGDTLFVGSVGRPDLLEGNISAAWLASQSFDTWHSKLSRLGDGVLVLPAHGAGSLCGAHLSDQPSSTIDAEKRSNPYLQYASKSDFIAAVLADLSEPPQYFKHNAAVNRQGPELVDWEAAPPEAPVSAELTDQSKTAVVDIRSAEEYAAGHIPDSINIGLRGRLETWVGIMVPWGKPLVLAGKPEELKEAATRVHRVGYQGSTITVERWKAANLPVATTQPIASAELYGLMQKNQAPVIVDVRLPSEWMGLRIGTVLNLPLNKLADLSAKLDPSQPVVTVCNSAYRSSMAVGILEAKGFKDVRSLAGGSEAWVKAGYPVFGASPGQNVAAGSGPVREIRLAERIAPSELKSLLLDLPGRYELVDIRPAPLFADYHLPGARNVDVADILNNPAYLTGASPLVLVDRDGSLAMQVGGILSQKTARAIKVLHGGLEAYWSETELNRAVKAVPLPAGAAPRAAGRGEGAPAAPQPSAAPAAAAKKKSAGC